MTLVRAALRLLVRVLSTSWQILGLSLIGLLCLELFAHWLMGRVPEDALQSNWRLDQAIRSSGLSEHDLPDDPDWIRELYRDMFHTVGKFELTSDATIWQPFVAWRSAPYAGRFINVDQQGLRRTINPPFATEAIDAEVVRIFMFGGSALWGFGARDEYTIPSLLSRQLNESGIAVEVRSFAQLGYVSTQEVICLLALLQHGEIPDIVIFFDGCNDASSAFVNQAPGLAYDAGRRRAEFNLLRRDTADILGLAAQNLATVRLVSLLRGGSQERMFETAAQYNDPATLALDVVRTYSHNVATIDALATQYNFATLFYWQPLIYEKNRLTDSERLAVEGREVNKLVMQTVYATFRSQQSQSKQKTTQPLLGSNVHYLGDLFDSPEWQTNSAFYDYCHLTESGNRAVAQRLSHDVEAILHK